MEDGRDKAIAAGREFVKLRYPDFVEDRKTPIVTDKGDTWEFTYRLPDDMLGGAPVVIFNKADLSVKESYRTQKSAAHYSPRLPRAATPSAHRS